MMSFPVASHAQYRLTEQDGGTPLKFTHQAFGPIPPNPEADVTQGWGELLAEIGAVAEKRHQAGV